MSTILGAFSIDVTANIARAQQQLDILRQYSVGIGEKIAAGLAAGAGIVLAEAGFRKLADALHGFTTGATEFQSSMNKIAALTSVGIDEIKGLGDAVLELSTRVPIGAKDLAEGLYFVASAGFTGSEAFKVMEASAKASAAGLGQVQEVAFTVAATLQAYQLSADHAERATDVLLTAVAEGTAEADSFAGAIGRVLPLASQAGVTFEEVAASMATMTRIGLNADEAATALRSTLGSLLAPSKETQQMLHQLGLSADELRESIREKGLAATLQQLIDLTGGNIDTLDKLIPNVRALTGVLATAGIQGDTYRQVLDRINNSQGRTAEAFEIASQTFAFQLKLLQTNLEAIEIQVGSRLLPSMTEFVSFLTSVLPTAMDAAGTAIKNLFSGFGDLGEGMKKAWTALKTGDFQGAMDAISTAVANTITSVKAQLAGMVDGFFSGGAAVISAWADGMMSAAGSTLDQAISWITNFVGSFLIGNSPPPAGPLQQIEQGGYNVAQAWVQGLTAAFQKVDVPIANVASKFDAIKDTIDTVSGATGFSALGMSLDQLNSKADSVDEHIRGITDSLNQLEGAATDVKQSIMDIDDEFKPMEKELQDQLDVINNRAQTERDELDLQLQLKLNENERLTIIAQGSLEERSRLESMNDQLSAQERILGLQQQAKDLSQAAKGPTDAQKRLEALRDQQKLNSLEQERLRVEKARKDHAPNASLLAKEYATHKQMFDAENAVQKEQQKGAADKATAQLQINSLKQQEVQNDIARDKLQNKPELARLGTEKHILEEKKKVNDAERKSFDLQKQIDALPIKINLQDVKKLHTDMLQPLKDQLDIYGRQREHLNQMKTTWGLIKSEITEAKNKLKDMPTNVGGGLPTGKPNTLPVDPKEAAKKMALEMQEEAAKTGKALAEKLGTGFHEWMTANGPKILGGAIGAALGLAIGGIPGMLLGGLVGVKFVESINKWMSEHEIDPEKLNFLIKVWVMSMTIPFENVFKNLAKGDFNGALLALGDGFNNLSGRFTQWLNEQWTKIEWTKVFDLTGKIGSFLTLSVEEGKIAALRFEAWLRDDVFTKIDWSFIGKFFDFSKGLNLDFGEMGKNLIGLLGDFFNTMDWTKVGEFVGKGLGIAFELAIRGLALIGRIPDLIFGVLFGTKTGNEGQDKFVEGTRQFVRGLFDGLWKHIQEFAQKEGPGIFIDAILGLITLASAGIGPAVLKIAAKIPLIGNLLAGLIEGATTGGAAIWTKLIAPLGESFVTEIGITFSRIAPKVWEAIGSALGFTKGAGSGLKDLAGAGGAGAQNLLDMIIGQGGFANSVAKFVGGVKEFIGNVIAGLGNIAGYFAAIGEQLLSGILKGMQEKASSFAADMAKWTLANIVQSVKDALGIKSPSTVFAEIADFLMKGFVAGLVAIQATVTAAMTSAANQAMAGFQVGLDSGWTVTTYPWLQQLGAKMLETLNATSSTDLTPAGAAYVAGLMAGFDGQTEVIKDSLGKWVTTNVVGTIMASTGSTQAGRNPIFQPVGISIIEGIEIGMRGELRGLEAWGRAIADWLIYGIEQQFYDRMDEIQGVIKTATGSPSAEPTGRANGGEFSSGQLIRVGERGPEWLRAGAGGGRVYKDADMLPTGKGGGGSLVVNFHKGAFEVTGGMNPVSTATVVAEVVEKKLRELAEDMFNAEGSVDSDLPGAD